jgi:hypothetical protein
VGKEVMTGALNCETKGSKRWKGWGDKEQELFFHTQSLVLVHVLFIQILREELTGIRIFS